MPKLRWLSKKGDSEIVFHTSIGERRARRRFNALAEEGFRAFKKAADGKHEPIETFDPTADEIVMVPKLVGG